MPENFLRGSTVYKRVIWTRDNEAEEEGYACIVCGDFVPDGCLNMESYYATHELLHISQGNRGLIGHDIIGNGWAWKVIDEKNLPKGVTWKK